MGANNTQDGPEVVVLTRDDFDKSLEAFLQKIRSVSAGDLHAAQKQFNANIDAEVEAWKQTLGDEFISPEDIQKLKSLLDRSSEEYVDTVSDAKFAEQIEFLREEMEKYFSADRKDEKGNIHNTIYNTSFSAMLTGFRIGSLVTKIKIVGKNLSFISLAISIPIAGSILLGYKTLDFFSPDFASKMYQKILFDLDQYKKGIRDVIHGSLDDYYKESNNEFFKKDVTDAIGIILSSGVMLKATNKKLIDVNETLGAISKTDLEKVAGFGGMLDTISGKLDALGAARHPSHPPYPAHTPPDTKVHISIVNHLNIIQAALKDLSNTPHPEFPKIPNVIPENIAKILKILKGFPTLAETNGPNGDVNTQLKQIIKLLQEPIFDTTDTNPIIAKIITLSDAIQELPSKPSLSTANIDYKSFAAKSTVAEAIAWAKTITPSFQDANAGDLKTSIIKKGVSEPVGCFVFSNSFFEPGSPSPKAVRKKSMIRIGTEALSFDWKENDYKIVIIGHADEDQYSEFGRDNCWLSKQRAAYFKDVLLLGRAPRQNIFLYGQSDLQNLGNDKPQSRRIEVYFSKSGQDLKTAINSGMCASAPSEKRKTLSCEEKQTYKWDKSK